MLTPGSTHPLVKILQSYLKVLGHYPIEQATSEFFDEPTQIAVEKFKENAGIRNEDETVEASVDDRTWTELIKRADSIFPPIGIIQSVANQAIETAVTQADIPNTVTQSVLQAIEQANISSKATTEVNNAIAQANISSKATTEVNKAIEQANISSKATTEVNKAIAQTNIPNTATTEVNKAIAQANISNTANTAVSNAITQADIPTKVSNTITQANISNIARNAVNTAVTQANISNAVNHAITQADIPQVARASVDVAVTQANIPKKISDAIEPAKKEVDTAAATTQATAVAMQTFSIHRDAIVAYQEAKKIAEAIAQITTQAVKDAGEAQIRLSSTLQNNARKAAEQTQIANDQAQKELNRATQLLNLTQTKAEEAQTEAKLANLVNAERAKDYAQKALNEIWAIAGKNHPTVNTEQMDSDMQAFFKREFKDLPTLKAEAEAYAEAARQGLDTVNIPTASSEPENLQSLLDVFLHQKTTSPPASSTEFLSDDYAAGLMYYFELENPASRVNNSNTISNRVTGVDGSNTGLTGATDRSIEATANRIDLSSEHAEGEPAAPITPG